MASFRDYLYQISPKWLQGFNGGRMVYLLGLSMDLLADKMDQGMRLHIPTYGDFSALPFLGADRLITRGPGEDNISYAYRLKLAWDDWGFAGSPRADLRETLSFWLPMTPEGLTVSDGNTTDGAIWNDYLASADTTQPPAHYIISPSNWDWDSLNLGGGAKWWRSWLVQYAVSPNDFTHPEGDWGDPGDWGDESESWGLDVPASYIASVRAILGQFQGEHQWYMWMIFSFDDTLFRPSGAIGVENPDGQWGRWSKYVTTGGLTECVQSRSESARYADGPP